MGPGEDARRWSPREKPPYLEAYPRISIGAVAREMRAGRTHLLWRDRRDLVVGAASASSSGEDRLLLHYAADYLGYTEETAGDLSLRLVRKGSQDNNKRPFACCPECPLHVDVLILKDRGWACTGCHRLRHRSSLIREVVRWSERLAELDAEIGSGKPHNMREPVFRGKAEERDSLLRCLSGNPVTANALYLTRVHTEWVSAPVLAMEAVPCG